MTGAIIGLILAGFLIYVVYYSPEARGRQQVDRDKQAKIRCTHCGAVGMVTRRAVVRKQGISGGKATGALFTGGLSMLATGLSRKQRFTRFTCENCGTSWEAA